MVHRSDWHRVTSTQGGTCLRWWCIWREAYQHGTITDRVMLLDFISLFRDATFFLFGTVHVWSGIGDFAVSPLPDHIGQRYRTKLRPTYTHASPLSISNHRQLCDVVHPQHIPFIPVPCKETQKVYWRILVAWYGIAFSLSRQCQ